MPAGSEFHTEGVSVAETTGSKGCVDPRNQQQVGVVCINERVSFAAFRAGATSAVYMK